MTQPDGPQAQNSQTSFALAATLSGLLDVRSVHRATGQVHTQHVPHPYAILGRAPQAGVRLDDPSVSQCHAYLQLVDGVPYCIDLGSRTGVLWDDGGRGRGWVHPGQTVRIGLYDVQITSGGPHEQTAPGGWLDPEHHNDPAAQATLDVHSPVGPSGSAVIDQPVTLVGRHPACNLRFLDEVVAYFQCALVKTRSGVWCVDLLSRGGTVVNGRAMRIVQLRSGDLIEIGKISILLRAGTQPASPVALFAPGGLRPPGSPADMVSAVITPFRDMMEQFQQSFAAMARMFTTMQQEHTAMMCEQMRQIQELLREVRDPSARPAVGAVNALPPPPAVGPSAPAPKPPTPRTVGADEARQLSDAHAWFLDRLGQNGTAATNKPKSN